MSTDDYKAAYNRQKLAREQAESTLEERSRELYEANMALSKAYDRLKNQKSQIIHQEKLAAIGQLSAGVAHEINNPTGFVKSNLQTLKRYSENITTAFDSIGKFLDDLNLPPEHYESVTKIKSANDIDYVMEDISDIVNDSIDGLNRIESIVNSLKNFSRPDGDEKEEFCVNVCMENTLKIVENQVKFHAEVNVDFGDVPMVIGKPGAMGQVFLNLIVNAADAIEGSGKIDIKTIAEDNHVVISVEDNGSGIPKNITEKIFEPFFTTKEIGKGTGLGLSICHGIIKKHGGRFEVDTLEGVGTKFSIYIPISCGKQSTKKEASKIDP